MTESTQQFYLSELSTLSLQHFVPYSPVFSTPALLPMELSALGFCSGRLWFSVCTCFSSFSSKLLPSLLGLPAHVPITLRPSISCCDLTSLTNLRIVDFSGGLLFYLLWQRGNVQVLYILDPKNHCLLYRWFYLPPENVLPVLFKAHAPKHWSHPFSNWWSWNGDETQFYKDSVYCWFILILQAWSFLRSGSSPSQPMGCGRFYSEYWKFWA